MPKRWTACCKDNDDGGRSSDNARAVAQHNKRTSAGIVLLRCILISIATLNGKWWLEGGETIYLPAPAQRPRSRSNSRFLIQDKLEDFFCFRKDEFFYGQPKRALSLLFQRAFFFVSALGVWGAFVNILSLLVSSFITPTPFQRSQHKLSLTFGKKGRFKESHR